MCLNRQKWCLEMPERMPGKLKLTSSRRRTTTKTPMLQNSKKRIMFKYYSLQQTIKETKILLRNFGGLGLTLLKRPYQLTNLSQKWYRQNTSASSYETIADHTPITHTRYTDHATRMAIRPEKYKYTWRFARQIMGVRIENVSLW